MELFAIIIYPTTLIVTVSYSIFLYNIWKWYRNQSNGIYSSNTYIDKYIKEKKLKPPASAVGKHVWFILRNLALVIFLWILSYILWNYKEFDFYKQLMECAKKNQHVCNTYCDSTPEDFEKLMENSGASTKTGVEEGSFGRWIRDMIDHGRIWIRDMIGHGKRFINAMNDPERRLIHDMIDPRSSYRGFVACLSVLYNSATSLLCFQPMGWKFCALSMTLLNVILVIFPFTSKSVTFTLTTLVNIAFMFFFYISKNVFDQQNKKDLPKKVAELCQQNNLHVELFTQSSDKFSFYVDVKYDGKTLKFKLEMPPDLLTEDEISSFLCSYLELIVLQRPLQILTLIIFFGSQIFLCGLQICWSKISTGQLTFVENFANDICIFLSILGYGLYYLNTMTWCGIKISARKYVENNDVEHLKSAYVKAWLREDCYFFEEPAWLNFFTYGISYDNILNIIEEKELELHSV